MFPNLSSLPATGDKRNRRRWLQIQRRRDPDREPNPDPITLEEWPGEKRDAKDGPAPKTGWVLRVLDENYNYVFEDQHLYNIDALARHLISNGFSPTTRRRVTHDEMKRCVEAANELRAQMRPPLAPLEIPSWRDYREGGNPSYNERQQAEREEAEWEAEWDAAWAAARPARAATRAAIPVWQEARERAAAAEVVAREAKERVRRAADRAWTGGTDEEYRAAVEAAATAVREWGAAEERSEEYRAAAEAVATATQEWEATGMASSAEMEALPEVRRDAAADARQARIAVRVARLEEESARRDEIEVAAAAERARGGESWAAREAYRAAAEVWRNEDAEMAAAERREREIRIRDTDPRLAERYAEEARAEALARPLPGGRLFGLTHSELAGGNRGG